MTLEVSSLLGTNAMKHSLKNSDFAAIPNSRMAGKSEVQSNIAMCNQRRVLSLFTTSDAESMGRLALVQKVVLAV